MFDTGRTGIWSGIICGHGRELFGLWGFGDGGIIIIIIIMMGYKYHHLSWYRISTYL